MRRDELRRGDLVEVKSPAEILATLDDRGMLDGLPFMPEMLQFSGRRFVVDKRAEKVCDTIGGYTSRQLPHGVMLEDLRCDGSGHDGCQADCRIFWKEEWLRPVDAGAPPRSTHNGVDAQAKLAELTTRSSKDTSGAKTIYACQATELLRYTRPLSTWDVKPYWREYTSGNVSFWHFAHIFSRAVVGQVMYKLGKRPWAPLKGNRKPGAKDPALGLQAGDRVRVKSPEQIAATLGADGKNRGLWFDREMLPFCGRAMTVRRRVKRFIDDRTAEMIELKTDSLTLEGAVCSGENSTSRWFCPRAIYPYWREAWLERLDGEPPMAATTETSETSVETEPVPAQAVEHVGLAQVSGPGPAPRPKDR